MFHNDSFHRSITTCLKACISLSIVLSFDVCFYFSIFLFTQFLSSLTLQLRVYVFTCVCVLYLSLYIVFFNRNFFLVFGSFPLYLFLECVLLVCTTFKGNRACSLNSSDSSYYSTQAKSFFQNIRGTHFQTSLTHNPDLRPGSKCLIIVLVRIGHF